MNDYLKYLGLPEAVIAKLPTDILDAATLYDGIQKIYAEIPAEQISKRKAIAKTLAEGTRSLLTNINLFLASIHVPKPQPQPEPTDVDDGQPEPPQGGTPPPKPEDETPRKLDDTTIGGLSVGDDIPSELIEEWVKSGKNAARKENNWRFDKSNHPIWGKEYRTIEAFYRIRGVLAIKMSGTRHDVLIAANGLKSALNYWLAEKSPVKIDSAVSIPARNKWFQEGLNYTSEEDNWTWRKLKSYENETDTDKKWIVEKLKYVKGEIAFQTYHDEDWAKADGYREFEKKFLDGESGENDDANVITDKFGKIIGAYGLKLYDKIPESKLTSWVSHGKNYLDGNKLVQYKIRFETKSGEREITEFKYAELNDDSKEIVFMIGGSGAMYVRAEGFKEFLEGKSGEKKEPKPKGKKPKKELTEKEKQALHKMKNIKDIEF